MPTQRTPTNVTVSVPMPPALAAAVESYAATNEVRTAEAVRRLVAKALRLPVAATKMGKAGRPSASENKGG